MKTKILALLKFSSSFHWQAVEFSDISFVINIIFHPSASAETPRPASESNSQLSHCNKPVLHPRSNIFRYYVGKLQLLRSHSWVEPVLGVIECFAHYFPLLVRWHCSLKCSLRKSLLAFFQPWNLWNMPHRCPKRSVPRLHGNTIYIKLRN